MPTVKQKRAFKKLVENSNSDTPKTMGAILLEAGYHPDTAIKPTQVTKSVGWQELLEQYVPDDLLVTVGIHGLAAMKRDQYSGEMYNDWGNIYKFWVTLAEMKHPKVTKTESDVTLRVMPILGGITHVSNDDRDSQSARLNEAN